MAREARWQRMLQVRGMGGVLGAIAIGVLTAGCSLDGLLGMENLPPDVADPATTETPQGALAAYYGTLAQFRKVFAGPPAARGDGSVAVIAGLLTDELHWGDVYREHRADQRDLPEAPEFDEDRTYAGLHRVRGQAMQAIGLLTEFAPGSEPLTGHLYAIQAYAEIFLAELYCSGIPLSTLDFRGDYTYREGSTTAQVYEHALALLDTALALTGDSMRFTNLARVGKARTLLGLGRFSDAAAAVMMVPDEFRYEVKYSGGESASENRNFAFRGIGVLPWDLSVADRKGKNGLDYMSSGDPRTRVEPSWGVNRRGMPIYFPSKYLPDGSSPVVLASGLEARLVEAEAALWAGDVDRWLEKLNHLRRTAWTTIVPPIAGPLEDLTDPGDHESRVDLLFRERAFWLFLTGHRQGDLRRLLRHYGRTQAQVYPVGAYVHPIQPGLSYGSYVDLPVPYGERVHNPRFTGCAARGA